jgi:signal transduction histidine kinase
MKSPLCAIESATEVLRDRLLGHEDEGQLSLYVEMIQRNTTRLETVVHDLLQVAKAGSATIEMDFREFDLIDALSAVVEHNRYLANEKGIRLEFRGPPKLTLTGDREKIGQAFSNLVSNAIKFSDRGSISVSVSEENRSIAVQVADEGKGINARHLNRIFDKFFQVDVSSKGTGVGLAIAKAWVDAHGGLIWAESPGEGKGTTFTFTLPKD